MNIKSVFEDLNKYVNKSDYNNSRMLKIELTRFVHTHKFGSGRNTGSKLVDLQTSLIQADKVHIETFPYSNRLEVFIHSPIGYSSDSAFSRCSQGHFIKVQDKLGKFHVIDVTDTDDNKIGERFERALGVEPILTLNKSKLKDDRKRREEALKLYADFYRYTFLNGTKDDVKALFGIAEVNLITEFQYTERFSLYSGASFIKQVRGGIELGWYQTSTYNSLPLVLKITGVKAVKTVQLRDIGVEKTGYYSHHDQLEILPEQCKNAKKLLSKFNKGEARV